MPYEEEQGTGLETEFQTALKRHQLAFEAEHEQREQSLEDLRFALVEESQWDDYTREIRKDRPKYEINRVVGAVNQVMSDVFQNQISIKVRPRTSGATEDMAETLNGLIRNIENESNFTFAKNVAAKEAFTGGFGAWQVITDYKDAEDFSGEQEIKITPVHSATTCVYFDPSSTDEHHRDAMWCFVDEAIGVEDFEKEFGRDAQQAQIAENNFDLNRGWSKDWQTRNTIKITNYWCKKPYKKKIAMFSDGKVREITKEVESVLDEMAEGGLTIVEEKTVDSFRVEHRKMSGAEFLTEPTYWPGENIPVVPLYGYKTRINGQFFYSGIVRFAKDAQRLYNYMTSSKVEETSVNLNKRIMATPAQVKGHEKHWSSTDPKDLLPYNPDPRVPGGAPIMPHGTPVNSALIESTYQADQDIQSTLNVYAQSLGSNPREQSGRALLAQQGRMEKGVSELHDSLARAVKRTGEILIDAIPHLFDTPRTERILMENGETELVEFNKTIVDQQTGKEVIVENDMNLGKYDVISDIGPSYQTQRQETKDEMKFLVQTAPELAPMAIPVILENSDSPAAREMADVLSMDLVRAGRKEPNQKQAQILEQEAQQKAQQGPSPEEIAIQLDLKMKELEVKEKEAEARLKAAESMIAEMKLPTQPEQEALENLKTKSEIAKNEATASKSIRDAREPYQTNFTKPVSDQD